MKANQRPDKRIHIRKKVAGGTTGAVLGAVVGGPVGALVGGVIGTVMGRAAETGKLQKLASKTGPGNARPVTKANRMANRVVRKTRPALKTASRPKGRAIQPKSKSRSRS